MFDNVVKPAAPKILLLDIETAPNIGYFWGLFDQTIPHGNIEEASYVLCWSAKWLGSEKIMTMSCQDKPGNDKPDQRKLYLPMLRGMHELLDEADVVVHYYGSKFDIPVMNKEFVTNRITPPSPYKQLDLKLIVGRVFKFESNKLDYVAERLGFGKKIETEFDWWTACMQNLPGAWDRMIKYNRHDVVLLEKVYNRLLPWIDSHPSYAAYLKTLVCPKCGSLKLQSRGQQVTQVSTYTRYHCQTCGGWSRGNKRVDSRQVMTMNIH